MALPKNLLDVLMKDYKNPEDLIGGTGPLKQLTKKLLGRTMQAEMTEHLRYKKHSGTFYIPRRGHHGYLRRDLFPQRLRPLLRQALPPQTVHFERPGRRGIRRGDLECLVGWVFGLKKDYLTRGEKMRAPKQRMSKKS